MPATVLIVANDKQVVTNLSGAFNKKEYQVLTVCSGRSARAQARARLPDAIIVDSNSPRLSARPLLRGLRADCNAVLVLLANNPHRAEGANLAHIVIPRSTPSKRITQRVRHALDNRPPREMRVGPITFYVLRRRIVRGARSQQLTPKESQLLQLFMARPGQTISRRTLMREVWHTDFLDDTRTLDVHIRWLRLKLEDDPQDPRFLITLRGEGYRLNPR